MILNLYNIVIYLYDKAMQIAALKNIKAKQWVDGRKNTYEYLEQTISDTDQIIWIHAPSLGEFEQARPLIKIVKKEYVQYKVLVTFYSSLLAQY